MTGDNLMKTQIDTGRTEKPSFAATVKDSGALSFTLCCEDVEGNDDEIRMEYNEPNVEVVDYTINRCHLDTNESLCLTICLKRGTWVFGR